MKKLSDHKKDYLVIKFIQQDAYVLNVNKNVAQPNTWSQRTTAPIASMKRFHATILMVRVRII